MADRETLIGMAERIEDFNQKLHGVVTNQDLSPSGAALAIALLVTTRGNLFADAAGILRALAAQGERG